MTKGKPTVSKDSVQFEQCAPVCCTCKYFQNVPGKENHKCQKNGFAVWKISLCDDWVDKKTGEVLDALA